MTEIRFVGPEYDGAEKDLRGLADKLSAIVNDTATSKFGETALKDPTDIEILPVCIDEPLLIVNAWHETGNPDQPGRLQVHDFSLRTSLEGENAYLATEDDKKYPVTTRETLVLIGLAEIAVFNILLSDRGNE